MSARAGASSAPISTERALWRLFLTLFLRGRGARGLKKGSAPQSLARKLWITLGVNALVSLLALYLVGQPVFALSSYMHAMAFIFIGMFVAASAGEVLFNKDEADILLHRPITSEQLLRAKIAVMVQISLWLAVSLNLTAFVVGTLAPGSSWLFVPVHALSTAMEALFCTGCVVVTYQLCLRWFGRERLDAFMTATQVLISIGFILGTQLAPQIMVRSDGSGLTINSSSWWTAMPPAWFAGVDDALVGTGSAKAWALTGVATLATAGIVWLAFVRLAGDYGRGLQTIQDVSTPRPARVRRRWIEKLLTVQPFRWWVGDSVSRAAFMLSAAYLVRDRDVKLRVYPGLAPMLVIPIFMLLPRSGRSPGDFGLAFAGSYIGLVPLMALGMLERSQHWQAADLFRAAPIGGPAALSHGARRAVLILVTLPTLVIFAALTVAMGVKPQSLALMIPGIIALPVYSLIPCLNGKGVPLSLPGDEAQSARRGGMMIGVVLFSMVMAGVAMWAWTGGWYAQFLAGEAIAAAVIYMGLRDAINGTRWSPID